MRRNIYFVRHAQPDLTVHEDAVRPLTALGQEQSSALAQVFIDKDITTIYSSPYLRCLQTAQPTADLLALNIHTHHGLVERKVGDHWIDNFNEFAEKQWLDFNYQLENGESLQTTQSRAMNALQDILYQTEGNIIIFGHGTALSTIFHHYDNSYGYGHFKDLKMPDIYCLNLSINALSRYAF